MMIVSWNPVIFIDILGSVLTLGLAFACANNSWKWVKSRPDDIFRQYIILLTLAIVFFAISRSFGHLVKQLLLLNNMGHVWHKLSPFSGAVNSAVFVVIFAFGIYFHRFQRVQLEIEKYKNNLEKLVLDRTSELAETNLTLKNVLNSSNPICITSIDFELLLANKAYYAIWPESEEHSGRIKCYESRPGSTCYTENCLLRKILSGKEEAIDEISKDFDGRKLEFIVTARPYRNAKGDLIGIVENFQDITDRKKTEVALSSERERLAVTLRSIGDGVITTDISGYILLINKVAEDLTGWSHKEAVGQKITNVFNVINKKNNEPDENPITEIIDSGRPIDLAYNIALVAKDGTVRSIADSGAPIRDKDGIIIGAVLVFRDITEQLKTEKELAKVKKLESIGVLAGGIAHDFNNFLAAVLGNINLVQLDKKLSQESQKMLDQAEKASLRAKGLTQQLLTFAKGGEPIKELTTLGDVISDSADFVLRGDKTFCQYSIPDDLWLVDIDKGQFSQVIQNIVLNASHAMPKGGIVTLTCENVYSQNESVPLPVEGRFVKIKIHDRGEGIPGALIDRIFDPYFSTKQKSSGLGLAISHSIISKHNGVITVESEEKKGTTFTIYLPASENYPDFTGSEEVIGKSVKPARILVMDDDIMVRKMVKAMLTRLGHEIDLASDGKEAIRSYEKALNSANGFDLVIMDLTIPGGMGGQEAVQQLLEIDSEARVIVSSGYSNNPIMASYKKFGFCGAMVKPYRLMDLSKAINDALLTTRS